MNPQPDKLTPRQIRALSLAFLLILLTFSSIVAGIYWKGNQTRQANRRTRIAQIQQERIKRTQQRQNQKNHATKPAKKKHMNQIQRGKTGQAEVTFDYPNSSGGNSDPLWRINTPISAVRYYGDDDIYSDPHGFSVTFSGQITVPADAPLGQYQCSYFERTGTQTPQNQPRHNKGFQFEVVENTGPVVPTNFPGAGWYGSGDCGADYYDATAHLSQHFSGGATQSASGVWGGNTSGPYGSACDAMVAVNTSFPGAAWYRLASDPCGPPVHITTASDWVTRSCGCAGTPQQIQGPFASEATAQPPIQTRYVCENGVCITRALCEHDPAFAASYQFPGECVLNCTSSPPQAYVRWRCNPNGRCEWFMTADATEGFPTCEAANCTTPAPPPQPPTYERYVCALRGGIPTCVQISTTNPAEGYPSCAEANCSGPTPPPPTVTYTRYRCNAGGACESFQTTDQSLGFASCDEASCQPPPPVLVTRYRCNAGGECQSFQTTNALEGFSSCAQANCAPPPPTLYWCQNGECESGTNPPAGVQTFASCEAAACDQIKFWCQNNTVQSGVAPPDGLTTYTDYQACYDAGCHEVVPPLYYWCVNGQPVQNTLRPTTDATGPFTSPPDCAPIIAPPTDCTYSPNALTVERRNDTALGDHLYLSLNAQGAQGSGGTNDCNNGWSLTLHHAVNDAPRADIAQSGSTFPLFHFTVPAEVGVHHFEAAFTKATCPAHIAEANFSITGPVTPGGGTGTGGSTGTNCPPCPPPPDPLAHCAPTIAFVLPDAGTALHNFTRVRVTITDPNEETDASHPNFARACNHETGGPALQLSLGDYPIPTEWKRVSGTPLNGIYETSFDTRDISNGAHQLKVSTRGVGCCRVVATRTVTLDNTLQGNIFYRDTFAQARDGMVIGDASIGIETRALEENTARRYWMQSAVRSGTALDGPYKHDDWPKHQPVLLTVGEQWDASGKRFERHNFSAHVTFRLPLAGQVRYRRKWTPQFFLSCFDLGAQKVAKIRQLSPGRHYVFTTSPPRVWIYGGDQMTLYADFSIPPTLDAGELTNNEDPAAFDFLDRAGSNTYAPTATDCAVFNDATGNATGTGDKIYVLVPPSNDFPRGEVFAFDHDSNQLSLEYGIRRENRVPRFIESVGGRVLCLYTHDAATSLPLATKRTRAYDLTFATPKLLWELPAPATFATVEADTLFVACGATLYAGDGQTAPSLLHEFPANVSAASSNFVGLENGQLWKQTTSGWVLSLSRTGRIGGVTAWTGGTTGETQTDDARGLCAGEGHELSGERANATWFDERTLRVPPDLAPKTVARVSALDHFSAPIPTTNDGTTTTPNDPTGEIEQPPQRDERLLIGTETSALFFVYQRSALSEKDGALPVSHDSTPRLFPFPRRITA